MLFATGIAFGWVVQVGTVFGDVWTSAVATFWGIGTVGNGMIVIGLAVFASCR